MILDTDQEYSPGQTLITSQGRSEVIRSELRSPGRWETIVIPVERPIAIGYARVSTDRQDHALQLDAIRKLGAVDVIEETASGYTDRPILDALIDRLRSGDRLIVWAIDRLGRDAVALLSLLARIASRGVQLVAVMDGTHRLDTADDHLIAGVRVIVADYEGRRKKERTRAGIEARRASGLPLGRPPALTAAQTREIVSRCLVAAPGDPHRLTARAAAELFGCSERTVRRVVAAARRGEVRV